jgi:hypothetical protein
MCAAILSLSYKLIARRHLEKSFNHTLTRDIDGRQALERLQQARTGIYCGPLRLLAWEIYEKLNGRALVRLMVVFINQSSPQLKLSALSRQSGYALRLV